MNTSAEKRLGLLLIVSGPAGVGKGTVDSAMLKRTPGMRLSVSATTRSPRPGEIDGVHYSFVSRETFREMIEADAFFEYMRVFDTDYYGTPKRFVLDSLEAGRDVLLEIDVQGAMLVKEKYPEAVLVFIAPPSMETLKKRLIGRGTETPQALEHRFATASGEMQLMRRYDYIVINDVVEDAVERLVHIVEAERCRRERNEELINRLLRRA